MTIFQLGFRPFFSLAAIAAVSLIGLWLPLWLGQISLDNYYPPYWWHAHEMLFGYTVAVISGFILTAVRNWTGIDTARNGMLIALSVLWLAGRLLPLVPFIPGIMIAIIDLIYLPLLAISLIKPLWSGENKINRVFLLILSLMSIANLLVHAEVLGYTQTASLGLTLMLDLVILLILMISGRVMPFFTNMGVPGTTATQRLWVERATIILMIALATAHLFFNRGWLIASLAIAISIVQLIRVAGWHSNGVWRKPVLWVLYTGYGWLIIGFILTGLAELNLYPESLATHALTVGVIGIFTLGMMARVSLGHTGRPMQTVTSMNIAFVILNVATFIRVFLPTLLPEQYSFWVQLSGGLWCVSFLIFAFTYLPILVQPRVDGKPG